MTNPIHRCKIQCHSIDPTAMEAMGLDDDQGKWMPFSFHMDVVVGCKLATDDEDILSYNCTTIFTDQGDTYIIDTPYEKFEQMFYDYYNVDSRKDNNPDSTEVYL